MLAALRRRRPSQREHAGNRREAHCPPGWVVAANAPFVGHRGSGASPFAITVTAIGAPDAARSGFRGGQTGRADRGAGIAGCWLLAVWPSTMPKRRVITPVALVVLSRRHPTPVKRWIICCSEMFPGRL